MLSWMYEYTRQDSIMNKCIRKRVGALPIIEKMVEFSLLIVT